MRKAKIIILYILKYMGLFWVMEKYNRRKLRILCYHGISCHDEHHFLPVLFMSEKLFRHRMALLSSLNYPVISLDVAVEGLNSGALPDNALVITFDDGWEGTFSKAVPILQTHNFPASIYITSYYAEKKVPVLNVLLQYILWKSDIGSLDLEVLEEEGLSGTASLNSREDRQQIGDKVLSHLEEKYPVEGRHDFFEKICQNLNVDWGWLQKTSMFRLASPEMIGEYSKLGAVEMELHTHRHVFPAGSYEECLKEIMENQTRLAAWTGKKSWHFCNPDGLYDKKQLPWLEKMGIKSATTVKSHLNKNDKNLWELDRFLDGENVSDIEFEAELCGMSGLFRKMKAIM